MPERFLGKREPANKPTLAISQFLTVEQEIPDHPHALPATRGPWTMDRNDQAGDCVVAGMNHTLQMIAWNLGLARTPWTDAKLLELYRTQNPDFEDWDQGGTDADQGMVIQLFLEEMVRRGEIVAFGALDFDNVELMRAATYIGGAIMTGELLRYPHADQDPWDAVSNAPIWGGHCTTTIGYDSDTGRQSCVTWGAVHGMTDAFTERHMDEAWFVLTRDMITHPSFRNHFDLAGFADAVADLTNGKVQVPVDVGPRPFPGVELDIWAHRALNRRGAPAYERIAAKAYQDWVAGQE